MATNRRLTSVKGKKFQLFCEKVNELRKNTISYEQATEWKSIMDDSDRSRQISDFLSMRDFSDEDLKKIGKYVFKLRITKWVYRVTFIVLFSAVILFAVIQYREAPLIYTYGNNIPVYSGPDSSAAKSGQLDIYGEKFNRDDTFMQPSVESMIVLDTTGLWVKVTANSFFKWLPFLRKESFVRRSDILFSVVEYEDYKALFHALKGTKNLLDMDTKIRVQMRQFIRKDPGLNASVFASDYPDRFEKTGFSKLMMTSPVNDTTYIFFRLLLGTGAKNFVIRYNKGRIIEMNNLMDINGEPLNHPAMFKQDPPIDLPDIYLFDLTTRKINRSIRPPYLRFNTN